MPSRFCVFVVACSALAACGSRVSVPDPVRGVWGADCANPLVSFSQDSIHVFPDNATYALDQVTFNGNDLIVKYTSPQGPVTENYMKSGETLRLDHGNYAGVETTWHKAPMDRCPGQ